MALRTCGGPASEPYFFLFSLDRFLGALSSMATGIAHFWTHSRAPSPGPRVRNESKKVDVPGHSMIFCECSDFSMTRKPRHSHRPVAATKGPAPVYLLDGAGKVRYVLLLAEQYQRVRPLLEAE